MEKNKSSVKRVKDSKRKGTWRRTERRKCDARVPATDGRGDI